jgi:cytochrome c oxidase assembly protein subunit 11
MTDQPMSDVRRPGSKAHRKVGIACALVAVGMVGAAYAAVPLYKLYCQVTGFNGTTQRAIKPSDTVVDRSITVRFDANVGPGLAWDFQPVTRSMTVKLGENALAVYRATNNAKVPITGSATYNVTPEQIGGFFAKVECFCFTEQTLQPGESVEMPVSFFVDPDILKDKDGREVDLITLSYTFYPVRKKDAVSDVRPAPAPRAGKGT